MRAFACSIAAHRLIIILLLFATLRARARERTSDMETARLRRARPLTAAITVDGKKSVSRTEVRKDE